MHRSLDLKSKAEKRAPKHVAMSVMDRHSLSMGGRLTERAGRRGCHRSMCHRKSMYTQSWGGGASKHVREVAGRRSNVCARLPENAQPPMHKSFQSNHISSDREEEGLPGGSE